jgi:hypothetical protein
MIEKHSTTGMRFNQMGHKEEEYEHISVQPCMDSIASCNACGRPNYDRSVKDKIEPSGLELFDLSINSNGFQASVTKLCPDCIKDLRSKLFKFSA